MRTILNKLAALSRLVEAAISIETMPHRVEYVGKHGVRYPRGNN